MDDTQKYPLFSVRALKGANERKQFTNPDPSELDKVVGFIPSIAGAQRKMNGIQLLQTVEGAPPIYNICQTNDSRRNIIVQTRDNVLLISEAEFFNQPIYTPTLTNIASFEEDSMAYGLIVHTEANNVSGGTAAGTFTARTLSHIVHQVNADGTAAAFITALAANRFTLAAGKYRIRGWCLGSGIATDILIARLYNVTAGAAAWNGGQNENTNAGQVAIAQENVTMFFAGYLDLAVPTQFELQQKTNNATPPEANGCGAPANLGHRELYAMIEIFQTA